MTLTPVRAQTICVSTEGSTSKGVHPKIVSERLGHAKVGFTLDTYAHAVKGMDEAAAIKIGTALQTAITAADKGRHQKSGH